MAPRLIQVDYDPFDYAGMLSKPDVYGRDSLVDALRADTAHRGSYADWMRPAHEVEGPSQWALGREVADRGVMAAGRSVAPKVNLADMLAMGTVGETIKDVGKGIPSEATRGAMDFVASLGVPGDPIPFMPDDVEDPDVRGRFGALEAQRQAEDKLNLYHPHTTLGQYAGSVARVGANPLNWAGPGTWPVKAAWNIASGVGGQAGADVAEHYGYNPAAGRLVGSFAPLGVGELWRATGPMVRAMPEGVAGVGGGKLTQPQPDALRGPAGMDTLADVLRTTTNRGIIDALPPPPRTHGERITARTKGMSDADVLNSDELWAMTRDLMAQRPQSFSSAYSTLASQRLGRPLTPEEMTTAMLQGAEAGIATPRRLYEPEPPQSQAIRREDIVRGRSGRPIQTAPLPIGTEGEILRRGYERATNPLPAGVEQPPLRQAMARGPAEPSLADLFAPPAGIDVLHSTPYSFKPEPGYPFGRFKHNPLAGEGSESVTPGTYFTESHGVSGQGGHYWNELLDAHFSGPEAMAANRLKAAAFDRPTAIASAQRDVDDWRNVIREGVPWHPDPAAQLEYAHKMLALRQRELEMLQSGDPVGPRTIEARINAEPEQLLNWERAIDPRSPVSDLVARSIAFPSPRAAEKYGAPSKNMLQMLEEASLGFRPQVSGQQAFNIIARGQGSKLDATRALSEAGVPGVQYLDKLSRDWLHPEAAAAPRPSTYNYIVFPGQEHLVDILKRYGVAGLSMLPPALAAQYQQRLQPVDHDPFE